MTDGIDRWLAQAARRREAAHRVRHRRVLQPLDAVRVHDGERVLINFSGNDYLGLAAHPELAAAASRTLADAASGAGASALVSGYRPQHQALETGLAEWLQRDAAVLFPSGYQANLAVAASLAGRDDCIVQDRLCHASLIDGARLSGARLLRYPHADAEGAARQLQRPGAGRKLLVSDGVFSMDGDVPPLPELAEHARSAGAWMVVDDAHGVGVCGPDGRGSVAAAGLGQAEVPVLVGTLGKAFGCSGAFVAGSRALAEHLVNEGRSYMYTTAPPPAVAAAGLAALKRVREDEWRREKLRELIARFRDGAGKLGLQLMPSDTPIQPLLCGDANTALELTEALIDRGFLAVAMRPPTVPEGSSRLRITLSAGHEPEQVDRLLEAVAACRDDR